MVTLPGTLYRNAQQIEDAGLPARIVSPYESRRIVWAGGREAKGLANVLNGAPAERVGAHLATSCVDSRADLLVLSNPTSFDLCSLAVPHAFDHVATRSIVAAVGGGPHSVLAATLADWLSLRLGVPACAVYGYRDPKEAGAGEEALSNTASRLPRLETRMVEAHSPAAMVGAFPPGTLLIVGAPGGSWFQRRFFGPGARIQAKAAGGTIVVKHNPSRVYQVMQPPVAYGPKMRVSDALELSEGSDVVVADHGTLLGVAAAEDLRAARGGLELLDVIGGDAFLSPEDEVSEVLGLLASHGGSPIPVVDDEMCLIGCVSEADLLSKPLV